MYDFAIIVNLSTGLGVRVSERLQERYYVLDWKDLVDLNLRALGITGDGEYAFLTYYVYEDHLNPREPSTDPSDIFSPATVRMQIEDGRVVREQEYKYLDELVA